jgi:hypothetical protein
MTPVCSEVFEAIQTALSLFGAVLPDFSIKIAFYRMKRSPI